MIQVTITNLNNSMVLVDEKVDGFALGMLKNDKEKVATQVAIGGEMSVKGYAILETVVNREMVQATHDATRQALEQAIEEFETNDIKEVIKDFIHKAKNFDDMFKDANQAEMEGMKAYNKSRQEYEKSKDECKETEDTRQRGF